MLAALELADRVLAVPDLLLELANAVEYVELGIPVSVLVVELVGAQIQIDPGGLDERLGHKALVHGRYVANLAAEYCAIAYNIRPRLEVIVNGFQWLLIIP